ncbi:MS ion channel protein 2 [Schizosaccharomyces japonicus yFS275]|uniref:Mechanosensitive ion channel protein n=1 Tax=Schizosaccharomyces japonicus (strain yFS275 / FY16936) TaxID=402676 RepID=B6JZH9_SCHJY|nr:MS ion channel protein 2 [Schizosaccharomyces japonicus yFS275]EEB06947.2 MS ion channel protein 2 [Schizosaccharomyces japonicus yFS275]
MSQENNAREKSEPNNVAFQTNANNTLSAENAQHQRFPSVISNEATAAISDGNSSDTQSAASATDEKINNANTDLRRLTTMGRFYKRFSQYPTVCRWFVYWLPLALIFMIPMAIGGSSAGRNARLGHVRILWIFMWVEVAWTGYWISLLCATLLPKFVVFFFGIISVSAVKYTTVLSAVRIPLSFVFSSIINLCTFPSIMIHKTDPASFANTTTATTTTITAKPTATSSSSSFSNLDTSHSKILGATLIAAVVLLLEKIILHLIAFNYHRIQYQYRIADNKSQISALMHMLEASKKAPHTSSVNVMQQDYILGLNLNTGKRVVKKKSPKYRARYLRWKARKMVRRTGDVVASAFMEMVGTDPKPKNTQEQIVLDSLSSPRHRTALIRRIWYSFTPSEYDSVHKDTLLKYLSPLEALNVLEWMDKNYDSQVSFEEFSEFVHVLASERFAIQSSLRDVDVALAKLDKVGLAIVSVLAFMIYVSFLDTSFETVITAVGAFLLSISFVFSTTAQELLSSIVFLFGKHPFDISDVVVINSNRYEVIKLSLLYTVFRTTNGTTVQAPNSLLNTLFIENMRRSKAQSESISLQIPFITEFKTLERLKELLLKFVGENLSDYKPMIDITVDDFSTLTSMTVKVIFYYKSNCQNVGLQISRRNKFMCALAIASRQLKLPATLIPTPGADVKHPLNVNFLNSPQPNVVVTGPDSSSSSSSQLSGTLHESPTPAAERDTSLPANANPAGWAIPAFTTVANQNLALNAYNNITSAVLSSENNSNDTDAGNDDTIQDTSTTTVTTEVVQDDDPSQQIPSNS